MNYPAIQITAPCLSHEGVVWFSAYGFGWGYRAFAIPHEAICKSLGARDTTGEQIRLAFQLGRRQIINTVAQQTLPSYQGQRIWLSLETPPNPSTEAVETLVSSNEPRIE